MDIKTAKLIVEAAQAEGIEGLSYRADYSGRQMYGATTAAISADSMADIVAAAFAAGREVESMDDQMLTDEAMLDLRHLQSDNMGRGVVVY